MDFFFLCNECGASYSSEECIYLCPKCSRHQKEGEFRRGVLEIRIDPDYLHSLAGHRSVCPADFMPYPLPDQTAFPVGGTPLVEPDILRAKTGMPGLYLKNDSANPSGSLKDRASQLVAAQARALDEETVVLASTGNAGSAMACAGAALGLEVILFVPETAPKAKLMQSVLYGAEVVPVRGTYDDAFSLSIEYTTRFGGINRNTAYNPFTIEGKKSVAIEIFNQLNRSVPDIVYVPTGDGVILGGVYKGFADLQEAGLIKRMPKIVCVQAEGSSAITRAFETGRMENLKHAITAADSISVSSPANGRGAVECIRKSGGHCILVSDDEITDAQVALCEDAGVFVEPAAAAAYSGYEKDRTSLEPGLNVVVLLTGSGFKDLKALENRVAVPLSVEPDIEEVKKYLTRNRY